MKKKTNQRMYSQTIYLSDEQKERIEYLCKELDASVSEIYSSALFIIQSQKEIIKEAIKNVYSNGEERLS